MQYTIFCRLKVKPVFEVMRFISKGLNLGEEAGAREEVEVDNLAFGPVGSAFCMFFGRTPVSTSNKPRAISPVKHFG